MRQVPNYINSFIDSFYNHAHSCFCLVVIIHYRTAHGSVLLVVATWSLFPWQQGFYMPLWFGSPRYSRDIQELVSSQQLSHPANQPGTDSGPTTGPQNDCQQDVPYKGNWSVAYCIFHLNSVDGTHGRCGKLLLPMMTSSNGNIFRITGLLCGDFPGDRGIPRTKASDAELWCFLWSAPEPTIEQTMETPVIWDCVHYHLIVMPHQTCWILADPVDGLLQGCDNSLSNTIIIILCLKWLIYIAGIKTTCGHNCLTLINLNDIFDKLFSSWYQLLMVEASLVKFSLRNVTGHHYY